MVNDQIIHDISLCVRYGDDVECAVGDVIGMIEDSLTLMQSHTIKEFNGIEKQFNVKTVFDCGAIVFLTETIINLIIREMIIIKE